MTEVEVTDWEVWEEYSEGMEVVQRQRVTNTDRWHTYHEMVVKDEEGKFWELAWRQGATEYQDLDFEDQHHTIVEVEPYQETVTKYKIKSDKENN